MIYFPQLSFSVVMRLKTGLPGVEATLSAANQSGFSTVLNGRFKGGYITRHYGAPKKGVHAIQLEMAQATYMDEGPPFTFRSDRAAKVTSAIRSMIKATLGELV